MDSATSTSSSSNSIKPRGGPTIRDSLYDVLGVVPTASPDEIRRAYHRRALRTHPDKNPNADPRIFQQIQEAYHILNDEHQRRVYDQFGLDAVKAHHEGHAPATATSGRHRRAPKASDVKYELKLELEDFYNGCTKTLQLPRRQVCPDCERFAQSLGSLTCPSCQGSGAQVVTRMIAPGLLQNIAKSCEPCSGTGVVRRTRPCSVCGGSGYQEKKDQVEVRVAPGAAPGETIVCYGKGDEKLGCEVGNLIVQLAEKDNGSTTFSSSSSKHNHHQAETPRWQRCAPGAVDLKLTCELSLEEALFGYKLRLRHMDGHVMLAQSPSGFVTNDRDIVKIPGEGMPLSARPGQFGDLYVHFRLILPSSKMLQESQVKTAFKQAFHLLSRRDGVQTSFVTTQPSSSSSSLASSFSPPLDPEEQQNTVIVIPVQPQDLPTYCCAGKPVAGCEEEGEDSMFPQQHDVPCTTQ